MERHIGAVLFRQGFNPRTRVGCDHPPRQTSAAAAKFQSTHPRGVRPLAALWGWTGQLWFQSTHPRGVRLHEGLIGHVFQQLFQSTHPRGVRRKKRFGRLCRAVVSIHAPAWGATCHFLLQKQASVLFQSTHPRGVRRASTSRASSVTPGFNPRTRVGCDETDGLCYKARGVFQSTHPRGVRRRPECRRGSEKAVSIHAPAWGATGQADAHPDGCRFQSTHPRGVRRRSVCIGPKGHKSFNPRTRVGCDISCLPRSAAMACFNPRTRVGCDSRPPTARPPAAVSIHAPAWGATNQWH